MAQSKKSGSAAKGQSLEALASKKSSAVGGFFGFFASSKKWWLLPPLVMLLLLGLLFVLSGTVAAPFIYTLF
jgi:hypothetical protein